MTNPANEVDSNMDALNNTPLTPDAQSESFCGPTTNPTPVGPFTESTPLPAQSFEDFTKEVNAAAERVAAQIRDAHIITNDEPMPAGLVIGGNTEGVLFAGTMEDFMDFITGAAADKHTTTTLKLRDDLLLAMSIAATHDAFPSHDEMAAILDKAGISEDQKTCIMGVMGGAIYILKVLADEMTKLSPDEREQFIKNGVMPDEDPLDRR